MRLVRTGIGALALALALGALIGGGISAEVAGAKTQGPSRVVRAATSKLGIAAVHQSRLGAECRTCHGSTLAPDDNETVENKACVGCHGDYAKLAPETVKKLKNRNINPHQSHLGPEIACTVCHSGHAESKAYCTECHTNFTMPMPGSAKN